MYVVLDNGKYYAFAEGEYAGGTISQPVTSGITNDAGFRFTQELYHDNGQGTTYPFWKCFSATQADNFWWYYTSNMNAYIWGEIFSPTPITMNSFGIYAATGTGASSSYWPSGILLNASVDGVDWVNLGTIPTATWSQSTPSMCKFTKTGSYNFHRIGVRGKSNYCQIGKIIFSATAESGLSLRGVM